jgi:hypothetical protein
VIGGDPHPRLRRGRRLDPDTGIGEDRQVQRRPWCMCGTCRESSFGCEDES